MKPHIRIYRSFGVPIYECTMGQYIGYGVSPRQAVYAMYVNRAMIICGGRM